MMDPRKKRMWIATVLGGAILVLSPALLGGIYSLVNWVSLTTLSPEAAGIGALFVAAAVGVLALGAAGGAVSYYVDGK